MSHRWSCLVVLAGCLQTGDVPCGDRVCPENTVCHAETQLCIAPAAETVCNEQSIADGDPCSGLGFTGICQAGFCLPGCGDGKIDQIGEGCDDGNFRSHDGCSSSCLVEVASWQTVPDPWEGVQSHVAAYHEGNNFLMLFGGQTLTGLRTIEWSSRYGAEGWQSSTSPNAPSPRIGATMAYDAARAKLVLFGGGTGAMYLNDTWEWAYNASDPAHSWVQRTNLSPSPPARQDAKLVFDTARNRLVLFGGEGPDGYLDDTWEFDGTTWVDRTAGTRPAARSLHAMAFDDARNRTVVVGGVGAGDDYLNDVWEYDGSTWSQAATPTLVGYRAGAAMTYWPDRGTVILFGGAVETTFLTSLGPKTVRTPTNETLEYNGSSWSRIPSTYSPPARSLASLTVAPAPQGLSGNDLYLIGGRQSNGQPPLGDVWRLSSSGWDDLSIQGIPYPRYGAPALFDDRTGALHLFGGRDLDVKRDVWSFVEAGWAQPDTTGTFSSRARYFHTAAYDVARDRIVMFGGIDENGTLTSSTFENAGDNTFAFETKSPATSPSARQQGVLAFDGTTAVLFGGIDAADATQDDTWTYDGSTWMKDTSTPHPQASQQAAAAYDEKNERMVLFDAAGKTWTHSSSGWSELVVDGDAPAARDRAAMTFDWTTQHVLLIGGQGSSGPLDEVWELDGKVWRKVDVAGTTPLPRFAFGLTASPRTRDVTLIGGATSGLIPYGDVWTFQRRSATPDEDCTNRMDDDGDGHPDTEDPRTTDPDCCLTAEHCRGR